MWGHEGGSMGAEKDDKKGADKMEMSERARMSKRKPATRSRSGGWAELRISLDPPKQGTVQEARK